MIRPILAATMVIGPALLVVGCSPRADLGSDLFWVSTLEVDTFSEWTGQAGGAATSDSSPNVIQVTAERAHRGQHAAKLTIAPTVMDMQANTGLLRAGGLPEAAYYSAWYFLPNPVTVGTFWTLFKLRQRLTLDDPASASELYDANFRSQPNGDLTFWIFDHRVGGGIPVQMPDVVVPVAKWFQIEVFYRNAQDDTGRATFWLNGALIVDVNGVPMGATPWVEWDVVNVGVNLSPNPVTIYVDDAAISRSRVGPNGILGD